jgi:small subunit ribosomal protein S20
MIECYKLCREILLFYLEVKRMPNIKSAIKRTKTNEARRLRNASAKSALRTAVKQADVAVVGTDVGAAKAAYGAAQKKLDKAATKGLIHKNAASRKKSRLAKKLNALSAQA